MAKVKVERRRNKRKEVRRKHKEMSVDLVH
jgi:hypothetical protein